MSNRRQAIISIDSDPIHWCIYAALAGDGLTDALMSMNAIQAAT